MAQRIVNLYDAKTTLSELVETLVTDDGKIVRYDGPVLW